MTTARYDLQSTSDQQDYRLYAPISAAAPSILPPEKAGNWAYPNPTMDAEQTAFAMVNGLAGRLYLSGYLNKMSAEQLSVVREALRIYPDVLRHNSRSLPQWPLGLPGWNDNFVALALADGNEVLLFLWLRGQAEDTVTLPLLGAAGKAARVEFLCPAAQDTWSAKWDQQLGAVCVSFDGAGESARVLKVSLETEL